ncbi:DUF6493 family protein [Hymenobacter cellulosivorans]|uniref:DUF6493 family protein n=1 Tax=Hymenobacter cellulosivorans TaxID=2932249 RepID=A0ABY4FF17_9BACT|nr:DUF6493 family protein [Hymenobacter cellulosivorans]UOQ54995.1 DUF6493 family protein [Hymenobacter cellulosivorans]
MSAVETFEYIIRHQSARELVPFLLALPKTDIIPVRKHTVKLKKELEAVVQLKPNTWGSRITRKQSMMLFLSGLRTYSRKEALANNFMGWWSDLTNEPYFWQILEHTRPDWVSDWLQRWSSSNQWYKPSYRLLRQLEDRQIIAYEARLFSGSVPGLLSDLCQPLCETAPVPAQAEKLVAQQLSTDTVLLTRDLPLVFDFDSAIDSHNASVQLRMDKKWWQSKEPLTWQNWSEKHPPQFITWLDIIRDLAAAGHLDRADLLTRSLLALRRDFRRPLLTWFKNLFVALQPMAAERLARQSELVELLAHPLPLVVNFALDQLKDLWANPGFEPAPLLLYAEGLLTRQDLKTALRALLGAFEKLVKREPNLAPTVARLTSSALANGDAGVQERAAKLLAGLLRAKNPVLSSEEAEEVTATISLYADLLTAAARTILASFLVAAPDSAATAAVAYAPVAEFAPDISAATAIAPVADWHELLFLTGQMVQQNEPAAAERWLDGLLRLRGQYPAGYAQQLRPYLLQILPWGLKGKTEEETTTFLRETTFKEGRNGQKELLSALLISWYLGFTQAKVPYVGIRDQQYSNPDPLLQVEQQRLAAVEARLQAAGAPLPLLSTPSHAPHWVAPSVLVQKLLAYQAAGHTPDTADLAIALARTAFQAETDTAVARQRLPELEHSELRALLGWFLAPADAEQALPMPTPAGRELTSVVQTVAKKFGQLNPFRQTPAAMPPVALAEALPWLWAVAGRTRRPTAQLPELLPLTTCPGVAEPWSPEWKFEQKSNTYKQSWNKEKPEVTTVWQELNVITKLPGKRPPSPLLLYSLHASLPHTNHYYLWLLKPDLPFLLTLLPNNPAPLHWHLLHTACHTDSQGPEGRDVVQHFLNSLLVPGPRFDDSTSVLLAMGIVHNAPVCRALALEVLLSAIAAGRLQPTLLGEALGKILAVEFAPLQRLTDVLAQTRAIDPLTDDAVRQLLDTLLPMLPAAPLRNTRKLIETYADLQSRTGQPVPAAVQSRLREWSSSATLKKAAAGLVMA